MPTLTLDIRVLGIPIFTVEEDDGVFSITDESGASIRGECGKHHAAAGHIDGVRVIESADTNVSTETLLAVEFTHDSGGGPKTGVLRIYGDERHEKQGELIFSAAAP